MQTPYVMERLMRMRCSAGEQLSVFQPRPLQQLPQAWRTERWQLHHRQVLVTCYGAPRRCFPDHIRMKQEHSAIGIW